jgi:hypothetical protein
MPRKGYKPTPEHRTHLSQALKLAYKEGRVQPWNKGLTKAKAPILSICHKGQIPWNKQFVTSICQICGKVFPVSPSYLKNGKYKCCSLQCMRIYQAKFRRSVYPKLEPSPQLSYVIGVLIGDGCISQYRHRSGKYSWNVILSVTDEAFALSFRQALLDLGLHPRLSLSKRDSTRKNCFRVTAFSKSFVEWFDALSEEQLARVVSKYPIEFLRGFYESEGTASQHRVCLVNTDVWKLEIARQLIESLGFQTSLLNYPRLPPAKTPYELHILGGQNEQFRFLSLLNPCIKRGRYESSFGHRL